MYCIVIVLIMFLMFIEQINYEGILKVFYEERFHEYSFHRSLTEVALSSLFGGYQLKKFIAYIFI